MKRILIILVAIISVVGLLSLLGYTTYQNQHGPQPVPTTVSIDKYNDAVATVKRHDAAYEYKLKQAAQDLLARDETIKARTAQRDSLCTTYKAFRPAPTPAQCQ